MSRRPRIGPTGEPLEDDPLSERFQAASSLRTSVDVWHDEDHELTSGHTIYADFQTSVRRPINPSSGFPPSSQPLAP